ncbi:MAG TPA: pyridoxine 5'-phosphate synthase [Caulobacteraceae bacterium]|nr:pyridoxine 5'-phosphate synthase [Caulobacteraceae bacterium]
MTQRIRLGVNIDHVATVRNARGGLHPDPVRAAELAIEAGADGITAHLREDRRHIRDADLARLADLCARTGKPLNFEMAVTEEMQAIGLRTRPHAACLVPERREERTTEGGLDAAGQFDRVAEVVRSFNAAGIRSSLFIEADPEQIRAAAEMGAPVVELHTGAWCDALGEGRIEEAGAIFRRLHEGARLADEAGIEVHAGHGLNYDTARTIAALPAVRELNIGHFLIGEAIFVGLPAALAAMRAAIDEGRAAFDHRHRL